MHDVPRKKLLYIEDDESAWRVVHRRLRDRYVLIRAKTDVEACVMLRQFGPDLCGILCDIHLGGDLSGLDLARLVRGKMDRSLLPTWAHDVPAIQAPIIVITGDPSRGHAALDAGVSAVLGKPIDFNALELALNPIPEQSSASSRRKSF